MSNTDDGRWPTEAQMKARGPVMIDREAIEKVAARLRQFVSVFDSDENATDDEPNFHEDVETLCVAALGPAVAATAGSAGAMRLEGLLARLKAIPDEKVAGDDARTGITYGFLRDFIRAFAAALAAPQAQEVHTCSSQYKMRELPDPDCKACTTVSRPLHSPTENKGE